MSSEGRGIRQAWPARRAAPWLLWGLAAVAAAGLGWSESRPAIPAIAESRPVSLAAPRAARLVAVEVAAGAAVEAGQLVARLDPTPVDAELAVAREELRRLELEVASRRATLRAGLLETSGRLESEVGRAELDLSQLEAQALRDRSELEQIEEQIARQTALVGERLASSSHLDALRLRRASLARSVEQWRRTLREARGHRGEASGRLESWRSLGRGAQCVSEEARIVELLSPASAAVDAQRQRCDQLEWQREALEIRAPLAGRVAEVVRSPGDTVAEGAPILTLVDEPRVVVAYVDQSAAGTVAVGDRALLQARDRSGMRLTGTVDALGAGIRELPVRLRPLPAVSSWCREVFIRLDPGPRPLPGQAFEARLRKGKAR